MRNINYFVCDKYIPDKCVRIVRYDTCSLQVLNISLVIDRSKAQEYQTHGTHGTLLLALIKNIARKGRTSWE